MILAALETPPGFQKQLGDRPDAETSPPITKTHSIDVLVSDKNRIFVDGRQSDVAHIYSDMRDVAIRRGPIHVALTADVKAQYGIIIRILDAAKIAGLNDVGSVSS